MRKLDHCNIVRLRYFFYSSGEKVTMSNRLAPPLPVTLTLFLSLPLALLLDCPLFLSLSLSLSLVYVLTHLMLPLTQWPKKTPPAETLETTACAGGCQSEMQCIYHAILRRYATRWPGSEPDAPE